MKEKERKFKKGDLVKIIKNIDDEENDSYVGLEGYIDWTNGYRINDGDYKYIYYLDVGVELIAAEEELELIRSAEEPYKVGDLVRLKDERGAEWSFNGDMDEFIGSIVNIKEIDYEHDRFRIEQDSRWSFSINDIDHIIIRADKYETESTEEPKPTPLTWLQIQERIGKPVWDNYDKKWRVIYMYREIKGNAKVVEFTDSSACYTYKEDRFYDEEVGE